MFDAILFSDPHIGNSLPHAVMDVNGVTDRLVDSCQALDWVLRQGAQRDLDVYCLGDFFDERLVDSVTLKMVGDIITSHRRPLFIIPGNHDASDQTNRHFSAEGISALSQYVVALTNDIIPDFGLAALQFASPENVLAWFADNKRDNLLLLAHLEVDGYGHGGAWRCSNGIPEHELAGWGAVLSGHFHARQSFSMAQGGYLGSLRQLDFSDEGKRQGTWLVSWDGDSLKQEFIELPNSPTFKTLEMTAEGLLGWEIVPTDTYVKVRLTGSIDEIRSVPKAEMREAALKSGVRRLIFEDRPEYHHTKKRMDADTTTSLNELVERYIQSPSVNIGSLDPVRLAAVGRRAVAEAQAKARHTHTPEISRTAQEGSAGDQPE